MTRELREGYHVAYLSRKTFDGNTEYIKRISVVIIGFAADTFPILKCKQSGVEYGDALIGIQPRSTPDANEFDVYVPY